MNALYASGVARIWAQSRSMTVEPNAVSAASPIAMPIMRATVTVADAMPKARSPRAATAAADRGVTVSPNPAPNSASQVATSPIGVAGVQAAIWTSATIDAASPISVVTRMPSARSTSPETSAPAAVAAASAPSASRCWSGPPYSTRSTNTAPPMIAVAKPYPVSSETSAADENEGARNQRVSMNGSALRRPIRIATTKPMTATTPSPAARTVGSAGSSGIGSLPASVTARSMAVRPIDAAAAPARSSRCSRRGMAHPVVAAQASAKVAIPSGTLR